MHQGTGSLEYRRVAFGLICVIYLALTFAYAILVPPWESPDEPAHYLYVAQLAERGRPPLEPAVRQRDSFCRDYPYISSNYQWYQPALGYLPATILYKTLDIVAPDSLPRWIPQLNPQFCKNPFTYHNLFLHANLGMLDIWKDRWGLLIIRIYSSLLGLAVIYAAYRIGCHLDKNGGWLGIAAAGWVGFLPQFTFINASVRSDTLTNAIAAFVFLLAVLMQTSKTRTNKLALGMGILLGLGLISKYTFVYIVPIGLLSVILVNPRSPRAWLKPLTLVMLPAILIVAAYYLTFAEARAALTYTITTPSKMRVRPDLFTFEYLKHALDDLLIGFFFARFGWLNVQVPTSCSRIAFGLWGTGAIITLAQLWHQKDTQKTTPSLKIVFLFSMIIMLAIVGLLLSIYRPGERHLFPTLAAWSCLGFWGWWQVLSARGQKIVTIAAPAFMLTFNLYALFFVLVPAYYK
jgi:hypothetical protein